MRKYTATRCAILSLVTMLLAVAIAPNAAAQTGTIPVVRQRIVIYDQNGGVTMGPDTATLPLTVASGQHFAGNRSLAARGGRFVQVYHSNPSGVNTVFFRSCSNGRDWSAPVRVSDPRFEKECFHASIRFLGRANVTNRLAVTYVSHDDATKQDTLWGTFSNDAGATWAPSVLVGAHPDATSIISTLTGIGDTLYSVWTRSTSGNSWDNTFLSRSRDGGQTWDSTIIAYAGLQFSFYSHAVAGASGRVWIVTGDDQFGKTNAKISRSTNGGGGWNALGNINSESGLTAPLNMIFYPHLERGSSNTIYSVWSDNREGQSNIYFSRSDNNGTNWTPHLRVNGSDSLSPAQNDGGVAGARRPAILLSGLGRLYVVWADDRQHPSNVEAERNRDIYVAQSTDDGETWSSSVRVNDAPQVLGQESPAFAIHSTGTTDSLLITWNDMRGTLSAAPDERAVMSPAGLSINSVGSDRISLEIAPALAGSRLVVTLVDPLGRAVARLFEGAAPAGSIPLPVAMQAGVYFIEARIGDGRVVEKVVVW